MDDQSRQNDPRAARVDPPGDADAEPEDPLRGESKFDVHLVPEHRRRDRGAQMVVVGGMLVFGALWHMIQDHAWGVGGIFVALGALLIWLGSRG